MARPLFQTWVGRNSELTWDYDVTADGRRFLIKALVFEERGSAMLVVLNWRQLSPAELGNSDRTFATRILATGASPQPYTHWPSGTLGREG